MAIQTQRSYSNAAGTLKAFYQFNTHKEKNRLDHFSFEQNDQKTSIDLSNIWINHWPASHLKGFKSYVMPDHDVSFTQNHEIFDLTFLGAKFSTLSLTIKVSGEKEEVLTLKAPERLTVVGLKKMVARQLGITNLILINLQHEGYSLDPVITLEQCGFENGTHLTLNLSSEPKKSPLPQEKITDHALEMGGGIGLFNFVKPDSAKMVPTQPAKPETPKWRIVHPGLNLIGSCTDKTCKAFNQTIYIKRGIGEFNMAEESAEATCPACTKPFEKEVNNCGFLDCLYTIKGMMEDGTKFSREDQVTPKNTFVTFEESINGISKITKWKYLKVITKSAT